MTRETTVRGIILAPGRGSRLNRTAKEAPKVLVEVGARRSSSGACALGGPDR